jgi:hypothetical protein
MNVLVLDAGNSIIKFKSSSGREDEFQHALKPLADAELDAIAARKDNALPEGYVRVNGQAYAYGNTAERHGNVMQRHRAARYTGDYYGVFTAIALARVQPRSGEYALFGSHAPGDVEYREELMKAAAGLWTVEIGEKTGDRALKFKVGYCNTFDEPQGGLMNVILAEDGRHYRNPAINGGSALVIDIGGRTTDLLAVLPGGEVDYSLADSADETGILHVIEAFWKGIKSNKQHRTKLVDVTNWDVIADRVREAIVTGVLRTGKGDLDCEAERDAAISLLINRFANVYRDRARSGLPYDTIILTGGGSALMHDHLMPILDHQRVILADDEIGKIHLANVRGGLKLWRFYEAEGLLE